MTAIIKLAHSLGMTVVSEGVETAAQKDELIKLGSDSCQGFYFARPMPATSFDASSRTTPTGTTGRRPRPIRW